MHRVRRDPREVRSHLPFALLLVWWAASAAHAQPVLRVRGGSRIEVWAEANDGAFQLRGVLRDEVGTPLPAHELRVSAGARSGRVVTDADGRFVFPRASAETAVVEFVGTDDYGPSEVSTRIEADRARVSLAVAMANDSQLVLDEPEHVVLVTASSTRSSDGLVIHLEDDTGGVRLSATTNASGAATFRVPSVTLGTTGSGRLTVRSEEDATRLPAQTEIPIERVRRPQLTWEGSLAGRFRVRGGRVDRRAIELRINGEPVATVFTDASGHFRFDAERVAPPTGPVVAHFTPDTPWILSADTPELTWVAAPRFRFPWRFALASCAALGVALVYAASARKSSHDESRQGVRAARARDLRPTRTLIDGTVCRLGGASLGSATVRVNGRQVVVGERGDFSLDLPSGAHCVEFEAPGFEPERRDLSIPHRGEWTGFRVTLVATRDLASRTVAETLAALAPTFPPTATDREVVARLGAADVGRFVEAAEKHIYGADAPNASDLANLEALASAARSRVESRVDGDSRASL